MSEEREKVENIINKIGVALYNHTKEFYDFDMLVCHELDYNQWKQLLGYIEYLEKENQQLKKQLPYNYITDDEYIKNIECKYLRSEKQNKLYKSVLDEIREYIEKEGEHTDCSGEPIYYLDEEQEEELLQILDKVGSNE